MIFKRKKRKTYEARCGRVWIPNFPATGYFVIESVLATRHDWKNHAIAWTATPWDAGLLRDAIPEADYIALDATGKLLR